MIRPELVEMLVCPETHATLSIASNELVAKVNRAVAKGRLTNKGGRPVDKPLDGGLVRSDQALLYPVVDEIPMLLVDEAIALDHPALEA